MVKPGCLEPACRLVTKQQWLRKVEAYAARAEHCKEDILQLLHRWGVNDEDGAWIIEQLEKNGYVSDARYAAAFVHDKVAFQGWGRQKIRMMLRMKRVPDAQIEEALNQIDESQYCRWIQKLIAEKKTYDSVKIIRFMLQRGFLLSEIKPYLAGSESLDSLE